MERKTNAILTLIVAGIPIYFIARIIALPKIPFAKQEIGTIIALAIVEIVIVAVMAWSRKE